MTPRVTGMNLRGFLGEHLSMNDDPYGGKKMFKDSDLVTNLKLRKRGLLKPIYIYGMGPGKPVYFSRKDLENFLPSLIQKARDEQGSPKNPVSSERR
jgi:hypothetical protein